MSLRSAFRKRLNKHRFGTPHAHPPESMGGPHRGTPETAASRPSSAPHRGGQQVPRKQSKDYAPVLRPFHPHPHAKNAPRGFGGPEVAPQGTRAKRRAGAQAQAQEQMPRKQSKNILMGTGQTPQAGKPKQGVWANPTRSHGGAAHGHFNVPQHSHARGPHGHADAAGKEYPGNVQRLSDAQAQRQQSKDIVGKMQGSFRKRWTGKAGSSGEWSAMRPGADDPARFSNWAGSRRKPTVKKADLHGAPRGGQGRLHGHVGPGGETHEHDYGEHGGVKISPPARPKPPSQPGPGQRGGRSAFDDEHKRKFGYARKAVSQSVVSPHPAPGKPDFSSPHTLRIARQNARMNPAMRGVMGAGDMHEHQGVAHSHPDAWDANDAVSHTHKAIRKHYGGESRTKPLTHPHFGNRGTPGGTQHTHPPEFPAEIKPAVKKAVRAAVRLAVQGGGDPVQQHGHSAWARDLPNRGVVSQHGHPGGEAEHHHQYTTQPKYHPPEQPAGAR